MPSRRIEDLDQRLRPLARQFVANCAAAGADALITCTYRSNAEQAAACAQGRPGGTNGPIVTNAKPGFSKRNYTTLRGAPASVAFDFVPLDHGKAVRD